MKVIFHPLIPVIFLIMTGCVEKFIPEIHGTRYYMVVNGLITDQPEVYKVKLSWTIPFGEKISEPMSGCDVTVRDDAGNVFKFAESETPGTYISDPVAFRGVPGRKYALRINTLDATPSHYSYESEPVKLIPVPPIDSLFYEKSILTEPSSWGGTKEGCQIYLNTHDPNGDCRYFRWDYSETWKIMIPYYQIKNQVCWVSNESNGIDIKSTLGLTEAFVNRHPVFLISNETDRLSVRYSIIVNQYSLNENEFAYWEKIRDVTQDVGGLYDIIPSSITGNLFCVEDPSERVIGYFSVSARTSKRIYIENIFNGIVNPYNNCVDEEWKICQYPQDACTLKTIDDTVKLFGLNQYRWIIIADADKGRVYTTLDHGCVDCTVRGTKTRPGFWKEYWEESK